VRRTESVAAVRRGRRNLRDDGIEAHGGQSARVGSAGLEIVGERRDDVDAGFPRSVRLTTTPMRRPGSIERWERMVL
jgi:hypothetical protein